jgi:hypothetical protein
MIQFKQKTKQHKPHSQGVGVSKGSMAIGNNILPKKGKS